MGCAVLFPSSLGQQFFLFLSRGPGPSSSASSSIQGRALTGVASESPSHFLSSSEGSTSSTLTNLLTRWSIPLRLGLSRKTLDLPNFVNPKALKVALCRHEYPIGLPLRVTLRSLGRPTLAPLRTSRFAPFPCCSKDLLPPEPGE